MGTINSAWRAHLAALEDGSCQSVSSNVIGCFGDIVDLVCAALIVGKGGSPIGSCLLYTFDAADDKRG